MFIRYQNIVIGGNSGPLIITNFDPPTLEVKNNYKDRPAADGQMVSRDTLTKAVWGFSIATNGANLAEALELASELQSAWQNEKVRTSAYHTILEYSHDGEKWYRIYGRPGRFTSITPDVHATLGVGRIEMEFIQTDPRTFSSQDRLIRINAVQAIQGGIQVPIVTPITTASSGGARTGRVVNNGEVAAPLIVTFHGPCTNPTIRSDGYELTYKGTLRYDQTVSINPVFQSVELKTGNQAYGVQVPGRLNRRARLSDLTSPPGYSDWTYSAIDETGTSYAELLTRDAYGAFK